MSSLLLIGTGLVGGSFALAAKARGVFDRVVGVDRDDHTLRRALEIGAIDATGTASSTDHDAVCVAVPVGTIADCVRDVAAGTFDGPVFDVGSVKGPIIDALDPVPVNFVPCHPIAGSEQQGPAAARADLFEDRVVFVTPVAGTDAAALETVRGYWRAVGARVVEENAAAHDERFAVVSHLPHLVAFAFMEVAARAGRLDHPGDGFRDFVRIAGADPDVWSDILGANATRVRRHLEELIRGLGSFAALIEEGGDGLRERIASAADMKRALDETAAP